MLHGTRRKSRAIQRNPAVETLCLSLRHPRFHLCPLQCEFPMRTAHQVPLSSIATGRSHALFDSDLASSRESIEASVKGLRVLCIGAAGSIGSSTTALIADLEPAALHLIDHNENDLTELVRRFRARPSALEVRDFRALPLEYGTHTMRLFLNTEEAYDLVLNFAAIKHV